MGCNNSKKAGEPQAAPEVVKAEEKPKTEPAETTAPPPAESAEDTDKPAETSEKRLAPGDKVSVSQNGGYEGEVVRCTTTDVLVKGPDDKEQWCEMEDVRTKAAVTEAAPPLYSEVSVGQTVRSVSGVSGTVKTRTTTEVLLQKADGSEEWVDIEDIAFLWVCVQAASNLRNADIISKSDPYCVCELVGKPESRVQTATVKDNLNPVWNFEAKMMSYGPDDWLSFDVFDKDMDIKRDDFLGRAKLSSEQLQGGFIGDLPLEDDAGKPVQGLLRVQVRVEGAKAAPEAKPAGRQEPKVEETKQAPPGKGWCC